MKTKTVRFLAISAVIIFSLGLAGCATAQKKASGEAHWRTLFNGKDLSGWTMKGQTGKVWVENGEIVCQKTTNTTEHTFLCTQEKFEDFIFEADFKLDGDFNSGFLVRCDDTPADAKVRLLGYQVKIDPTPRKWTGGVFEDFGPNWNWMYTLSNNVPAREAFKLTDWNHVRVEAIGPSIKVWLNGVPASNLINHKYARGYIAIKIHALRGNDPVAVKTLIHCKNIRILTENPTQFATAMDIPVITVP